MIEVPQSTTCEHETVHGREPAEERNERERRKHESQERPDDQHQEARVPAADSIGTVHSERLRAGACVGGEKRSNEGERRDLAERARI